MTEIKLLSIDLAKNIFHIHGTDGAGETVLEKKLRRAALKRYLAALPPCRIAMESCGGANYWGRYCQSLGHEVVLIHPRRVAMFLGAHKSDTRDARAITTAARQPDTRFIPVKTMTQQDLGSLLRLREGLLGQRTETVNRLRGLLAEYGHVYPKGRARFCRQLPLWLAELELAPALLRGLEMQALMLLEIEAQIRELDGLIKAQLKADERAPWLLSIPGIGPLTAAALIAAVDDPGLYASARMFAAWLGLVPRQHGTGGRTRLLRITKRGNALIRKWLVQGAHSLITVAGRQQQPRNRLEAFIMRKRAENLNRNVLAVAVANRLARIAWACLSKQTGFNPAG